MRHSYPINIFSDEEISILNVIAVDTQKEDLIKKLKLGMVSLEDSVVVNLYNNILYLISSMGKPAYEKLQKLLPARITLSYEYESTFVDIFAHEKIEDCF